MKEKVAESDAFYANTSRSEHAKMEETENFEYFNWIFSCFSFKVCGKIKIDNSFGMRLA